MDIDKEIYKILSGGIISIVDTTDGKKIVGIASASEVITDFIENLLEQEKKRMSDEIEKKAKIFDIAVSNVKVSSVKLVKLSDALAIINK